MIYLSGNYPFNSQDIALRVKYFREKERYREREREKERYREREREREKERYREREREREGKIQREIERESERVMTLLHNFEFFSLFLSLTLQISGSILIHSN